MSEPEHITNPEFLQAVFSNLEEGETPAVCAFKGPVEEREYWTVNRPTDPRVADALSTTAGNHYFCISSVADEPTLRRTSGQLRRTFVIPLDDVGTGLGAKVTPAEVPVSPTYIIQTSPNNYQYGYVLEEPEADLCASKTLIKLMALKIGADVGGSMAAKLIRLPQGYNAKKEYGLLPPPTKMTLWNPERKFTVDELIEAFEIDVEVFNREYDSLNFTSKTTLGANYQDDVLKWLLHSNAVHTESADAAGFLTVTCPWHSLHTDGSVGAGYSPLGEGGNYQTTRQFNCLHSHCSKFGPEDLTMLMFQDRFSYCETDKLVRDKVKPGVQYKVSDFHIAMAPYHFYVPKDPDKPDGPQIKQYHSKLWMERTDRIDVISETFMPHADTVGPFKDLVSGKVMFNSFEPYTTIRPYTNAEDKIQPILDHLRYLFGSEYENALGFLAYSIHEPSIRLGFALLHVAQHHGTGRGWLKHLLDKMFVLPYHSPASFQNYVNTSYNEFLYRKLLVTFDEVYDRKERFTVGERLRELITEKSMEMNVKYGFKGELPVFANFMFFSNHIDALSIPDDDRRFWCVICEEEPRSPDYYVTLYDLLEDESTMAQFFWHLKRVLATTAFNPKGRAPRTEWTDEMKASTDDDDLETPVKERVAELRMMGAKAIWRSQLISDCRVVGAVLPDTGSRHLDNLLKNLRLRKSKYRVNRQGPQGKRVRETIYYLGSPASTPAEGKEWAEETEKNALSTGGGHLFGIQGGLSELAKKRDEDLPESPREGSD